MMLLNAIARRQRRQACSKRLKLTGSAMAGFRGRLERATLVGAARPPRTYMHAFWYS
jgi:hypothetical protein